MRKFSYEQENEVTSHEQLDRGAFGVVYKNPDGTLTKIMDDFRVSPRVIIRIKDMHLDNFYNILQTYYRMYNHTRYLKAYDMDYIRPMKSNIRNLPIEYLLDSIEKLIKSIKALSQKQIVADDLKQDNLIAGYKGIYVIDCETYKHEPTFSVKAIEEYNLEMLRDSIHNLIINLLLRDRKKMSKKELYRMYNLFHDQTFNSILNTLSNYETLGQYLKSK